MTRKIERIKQLEKDNKTYVRVNKYLQQVKGDLERTNQALDFQLKGLAQILCFYRQNELDQLPDFNGETALCVSPVPASQQKRKSKNLDVPKPVELSDQVTNQKLDRRKKQPVYQKPLKQFFEMQI